MDNAPEASSQRIRYHLRRPIPERCELINENARNTVNEIVPAATSGSVLRKILPVGRYGGLFGPNGEISITKVRLRSFLRVGEPPTLRGSVE